MVTVCPNYLYVRLNNFDYDFMRQLLTRFQTIVIPHRIFVSAVLMVFVVLAATAFPRLMVVGGLPTTDEGAYAYYAQFIHANLAAGRGLPDAGMLDIYPLMLSWVFSLPANHMILLRLADMFVAVVASCLLYSVIEQESGSRVGGALISLVFLFTMNQPIFIQTGFKNSIFAAYIPLFLALRLGTANKVGAHWEWVGALVALAVLLRETFFPFLIVGALAIAKAYGWRACLRFILGTSIAILVVMVGIAIARGGIANLIEGYRDAAALYDAVAGRDVNLFVNNGIASAREAAVALAFGGLGVIAIFIGLITRNRQVSPGRFIFWLFVATVPLLEPASKIGFPYHFAVCLPGLAGLAAFGWKSATTGRDASIKLIFATAAAMVGVVMLFPKTTTLVEYWPHTRSTLESASTGSWPNEATASSNYLLAAEAIRKVAPPNGTLSVSGFMHALYPLTGMLPPCHELSNLSATLIKLNLDGIRFKQALLACPPDVLMTTTRTNWPGADTLTKAVEDSGLYEQVAIIPVAPDKSYGGFGGTIYRRKNHAQGSGS